MRNHASLQRRPFLTPLWLMALTAMTGSLLLVLAAWVVLTADSTTIVVVRHAEKVEGAGADPPLTPAGEARAALLASMFGDARLPGHVDAIYVSPALRNRLTAAPLAARLALTPTVVPADDPRALVRRVLHEHPGGRILVIGHSDTVPDIVAVLTGQSIPPIGQQEYGIMYIVTVPRIGHANFLRLNY